MNHVLAVDAPQSLQQLVQNAFQLLIANFLIVDDFYQVPLLDVFEHQIHVILVLEVF